MRTGRPSAYNPSIHVPVVAFYAQEGLTIPEIAQRFGVNQDTIHEWAKRYPDFSEALKTTKEEADSKVVQSLYQKALKGDTTACIFWLKNRQPDKWRDAWKIEGNLEHSGTLTLKGKLDLSIEQVVKQYADAGSSPVSSENGTGQ